MGDKKGFDHIARVSIGLLIALVILSFVVVVTIHLLKGNPNENNEFFKETLQFIIYAFVGFIIGKKSTSS
jgi:hypothetical protein